MNQNFIHDEIKKSEFKACLLSLGAEFFVFQFTI